MAQILEDFRYWWGGGWRTWDSETSPPPHRTNPRATCLDVSDLMSLQFKIVYEKQSTTIMASFSLYTGHVTTLFLPPEWWQEQRITK